jgi:hypothetical protein
LFERFSPQLFAGTIKYKDGRGPTGWKMVKLYTV